MIVIGYEIIFLLISFVYSRKLTPLESQQLRWTCGMSLDFNYSTQPNDEQMQRVMPLSYGGHRFNPMKYSWVVTISIRDEGNHCSGALISSRHVLTAAHCVIKTPREVYTPQECKRKGYQNTRQLSAPIEEFVILIGSHCEEATECPSFRTRKVRSFHVPNDSDECTGMNDIAILELEKDVPISVAIPICLPRANTLLAWNLNAAGSGASAPFDLASSRPYQVVKVRLVATSKNKTIITTAPKGVGICDGDSGGPLFQTDRYGRSTIVGVMSIGNTCYENYRKRKTRAIPLDEFTDVRQNLDWICNITGICHRRNLHPLPSPPWWQRVF
ncbi:Peptidase S1 domain-containing protein [Trichostrongylus colubriformis]|uniref:Peptidase S1 domain-containing protein n=1 Tax=Trichostrongylus colubriformis TaxID=6319 RepID=A0AAN8ETS3_TRICO